MYKIEYYRLDVENTQFTYLGESITFTNLYYDEIKNGIGTCTFNLSIYDEFAKSQYLQKYSTVIVIKKNNTPMWTGMIVNDNGSYEDVGGEIVVEAYTYLYYFKNRFTQKEIIYSQEEQCEIAWDLIDYSQSLDNGDLLITQGTSPTSEQRDRTYNFYTIAQAITNLTNVIDGFDFSFDSVFDSNGRLSGIKYNCYYPRQGSKREDLGVLEEGINIQLTAWTSISKLYNQIIVEGSGTGNPLLYNEGDSDLQKAYTRIENYIARKDISEPDTLDEFGDEELNTNKVDGYRFMIRSNPSSDFVFSRLNLGDSILCTIKAGNRFSYTKREAFINKLRVNVDSQGVDILSFEVDIYG